MNTPPEGPIDVNGEYTPTTKQKIPQIDADAWPNMNINDLWSQRIALHNRLLIVQNTYNDPIIIRQMYEGIAKIDAVIQSKQTESKDIQTNNLHNTGLI